MLPRSFYAYMETPAGKSKSSFTVTSIISGSKKPISLPSTVSNGRMKSTRCTQTVLFSSKGFMRLKRNGTKIVQSQWIWSGGKRLSETTPDEEDTIPARADRQQVNPSRKAMRLSAAMLPEMQAHSNLHERGKDCVGKRKTAEA